MGLFDVFKSEEHVDHTLQKMIYTLAMAAGVTPEKLAEFSVEKEAMHDYAKAYGIALHKAIMRDPRFPHDMKEAVDYILNRTLEEEERAKNY